MYEINRRRYYIMDWSLGSLAYRIVVQQGDKLEHVAGPYIDIEEAERDLVSAAEKWERKQHEKL